MPENKYETRILFLKEFTKELILNSRPLHQEKDEIEEDKLSGFKKSAYLPSRSSPKKNAERTYPLLKNPMSIAKRMYAPSPMAPKVAAKPTEPTIPSIMNEGGYSPSISARPLSSQMNTTVKAPNKISPFSKSVIANASLTPLISESELKYEKVPPGFDLGKINFLINDPKVMVIECPGPGKNLLAKVLNQVTMTKIILNQEEISSMIKLFSDKSRIPLLGGLFKAAVGNLVMTAVTSEIIGSRFVITKISPYFS